MIMIKLKIKNNFLKNKFIYDKSNIIINKKLDNENFKIILIII